LLKSIHQTGVCPTLKLPLVIIGKKSDTIVGAHLLGGPAGETINIFAATIRNRLPVRELSAGIYVYSTATSDIN